MRDPLVVLAVFPGMVGIGCFIYRGFVSDECKRFSLKVTGVFLIAISLFILAYMPWTA